MPVDGLNSAAVFVLQPPKRMGKNIIPTPAEKKHACLRHNVIMSNGESVLNSFHQDYSTYSSYVASLDVVHFSPPPNFLSLISDRNGGERNSNF